MPTFTLVKNHLPSTVARSALPHGRKRLTVDGLLLEYALGQATALLRELALAGAGSQQLVLHPLAVNLLGVGSARDTSLEAAVEAAPGRAPCSQPQARGKRGRLGLA